MTTDTTDPFAEGSEAYLSGQPESANPYDVEDDAHLEWNDGWLAMREAENDF